MMGANHRHRDAQGGDLLSLKLDTRNEFDRAPSRLKSAKLLGCVAHVWRVARNTAGATNRWTRERNLEFDRHLRSDNRHGQLVTRRLDELHPHPAYVRHHLAVAAHKLSALAELDDLPFRDPLVIMCDGTILDGYARWELARLQERPTLICIRYEMTEAEGLHCLIRRHCGSSGLNHFCRILLALELEPWLRERALSNQRAGGQNKGSSKLTEARRLDVRSEIAKASGACNGNITKVKRLMTTAHPEVLDALRNGEIRIHRAWRWSRESSEAQIEMLRLFRSKSGIGKAIRRLISRHNPKSLLAVSDLKRLICVLSTIDSSELRSVGVSVVKISGKAVYVTEELIQAFALQKEFFTCETENY